MGVRGVHDIATVAGTAEPAIHDTLDAPLTFGDIFGGGGPPLGDGIDPVGRSAVVASGVAKEVVIRHIPRMSRRHFCQLIVPLKRWCRRHFVIATCAVLAARLIDQFQDLRSRADFAG